LLRNENSCLVVFHTLPASGLEYPLPWKVA
jgi:hypothetical protein